MEIVLFSKKREKIGGVEIENWDWIVNGDFINSVRGLFVPNREQ
jgi:hypothetical protein